MQFEPLFSDYDIFLKKYGLIMKTLVRGAERIVLFILLPVVIMAQTTPRDTLYVTVSTDTITFHHDRTKRSCEAAFDLRYTLEGSVFTLFEKDTSTSLSFCNCIYDLSLKVAGISSGNYIVNFYGKDYAKDTVYFGSVGFTVPVNGNLQSNDTIINENQSDCYNLTEITEDTAPPESYRLYPLYPNPFNPSTKIKFDIPKAGNVELKVYNTNGELVKELVNRYLTPGKYVVNFNASGKASGIYLITLSYNGKVFTEKALLIK